MSDAQAGQPITEHLTELRIRLVRVLLILFVGFGICYAFSEKIFNVIRAPIVPYLPAGVTGLHYTGVFEKFMAHIKIAFVCGALISAPFWLYHLWKFISPALYKNEKREIRFRRRKEPASRYC